MEGGSLHTQTHHHHHLLLLQGEKEKERESSREVESSRDAAGPCCGDQETAEGDPGEGGEGLHHDDGVLRPGLLPEGLLLPAGAAVVAPLLLLLRRQRHLRGRRRLLPRR